jgi:hypothetical protein
MANIVIKSKKHGKKNFTAQQSVVQSSRTTPKPVNTSLLSKEEQAEVANLQGKKVTGAKEARKVQEALRSSGILPQIAQNSRVYAQVHKVLASYVKGIRSEDDARRALADTKVSNDDWNHIFDILGGSKDSKQRKKVVPAELPEEKPVAEGAVAPSGGTTQVSKEVSVTKKPGLDKLRKMYEQAEAQDVSAQDILTNLSKKKSEDKPQADKVQLQSMPKPEKPQQAIPQPKRIPMPTAPKQAVESAVPSIPKSTQPPARKAVVPPPASATRIPAPTPPSTPIAPSGVVKPVSIKEPGVAQKPTISDVTPPQRIAPPSAVTGVRTNQLTGPLDELRQMDLVTFRRLHDSVEVRIDKLSEKLSLLEQQHYPDRLKGIQAWKESPLFTEYVSLGYESLYEGKPLEDVLSAHGGSSLSMKEFIAILDFNKSLGY